MTQSSPAIAVEVGGIPVRQTDLQAAVQECLERARRGPSVAYRLVNSYSMALAGRDPLYHSLLNDPNGVNLPDGKPLSIAARWLLGASDVRQVRGPSFFERCLDVGRAKGVRHFFLGGTEQTLAALLQRVHERYPGIEVVGSYSPPFRAMTTSERRALETLIEGSRANVVWVGLGTPKQDFEAQRLRDANDIVTVGVGAAFDFLAGTKREAPKIVRRLGFEWMFRLLTEPRRLWRRYLFGNVRFLTMIWCERRRSRE